MNHFMQDGVVVDPSTVKQIRSLIDRHFTDGTEPDAAAHYLGTVMTPEGERNLYMRHAVDAMVADREENVLLIRRGKPPHKHKLATPGGMMDPAEGNEVEVTADAAYRELSEETGADTAAIKAHSSLHDLPGAIGQRRYFRDGVDIRQASRDIVIGKAIKSLAGVPAPHGDVIQEGDLFAVSTKGFLLAYDGMLDPTAYSGCDDAEDAVVKPFASCDPQEFGFADHHPMVQAAVEQARIVLHRGQDR